MATGLPDLPSGVYRHYKGPLYFVFGYGHDANALDLYPAQGIDASLTPFVDRTVVVYMGLELTDAHKGPRIAVRTADDFHALVHSGDGSVCDGHDGDSCKGGVAKRFSYVGPTWEGSG